MLHFFLTLQTKKYSYLSCCYFSRQKIGLSSTKVEISCLQKNSLYLIFIIVPYPLQKILPKLLLSLTHFSRTTASTIFCYEWKQINIAQVQTFMTKHEVRAVYWWKVLSTQILGSHVFCSFCTKRCPQTLPPCLCRVMYCNGVTSPPHLCTDQGGPTT